MIFSQKKTLGLLLVKITTNKERSVNLTPTQQRLMERLGDGQEHLPESMMDCLGDELQDVKNMAVYIFRLNKKIRPKGLEVLAVSRGKYKTSKYKLVRLIVSSNE